MYKLMVGLVLIALGLLVGLVMVVPFEEFGHSDRICLINESPSEEWIYGSSLEFEASIIPGRSHGGIPYMTVNVFEDKIQVSVSENSEDLHWIIVSPYGRFSDMEIIWPNGESS